MKFSTCVKIGAGFYIGYTVLQGIDMGLGKIFGPKLQQLAEKLDKNIEGEAQ